MHVSTIGRYQIVERLGQGGMGVVYRAYDPQIERTVAIKVISAQLVDQPEHRERFFREARAAGRLTHRNIITIFDLGEDQGQPYIAMEYVEGQPLDVRLRAGEPLTLSQKLAIITEISDALAFAHRAGIVHRDMKPGNVMLTRSGGVRILDFGLARLVTSELTRSNIVVGTMNYMAPEQIRAEPVDHRSDIFSAGVLLYELLSGRKAFEADSFAATMYKVLQERPAPLTAIVPEVPTAIVAIVDRAIEKDRDRRYQSMDEMLADLEDVRALLPPPAPIRLAEGEGFRWAGAATRPPSGPPPEPETTADMPHVRMTRGGPAPAPRVLSSKMGPVKSTARPPGHVTARSETTPDSAPTMIATPSIAPAQARSSRLVPILGAAALVAIAIAIVAYVLRPSGGPTRPDAAPATSQAPAAPADATPSNPGTTPAPPPAPAPQREPPASITDSDEPQTESARALYQAGKYDEAARAAGRVLKKSPQNAEAQKLMAEVARYARQAAAESMTGLASARARAEAAAAPSLANEAYARAMRSERAARSLFAAGDYAKATSAGYTAQGLFEAAAVEALGRAQDRTAANQPPARAPSPPPSEAQRQASLPPVATVPVPTPTPAPPPAAAPAPPSPAPAPQVAERRTPDPQEAIRRTLDQYANALEARSLPALKRVWPGLGGAQERAIRDEFQNARSISVTLESPRIQVSGDTATAVATRHYALSTLDGHELRSDARSVFQLRASDAAWLIESVRFEAAR
jgi:serine/threonine protein kinase/tetratricopeptide (TPR) repeat protein